MEHKSNLEEALKSRKQITDDFFGQVQVDTDYSSAQKKKYLIYTKMYNDEKAAEREAALKRKRKALKDDFFVNLEDYSLEVKKNLCSTNYLVRSFYEFPQKSLKREIYTRRKNSKTSKFTMEEMTHLFYNTVLAGKKLQENGKTHGDISPFCIFHNNEGKFKLAPYPIESASPLKIQQEKNMKGQPLYLSPQMLFAVKKRKPKAQCDPYKSDMFSLGLVLLEAGLLKPIGNIYSGSTINETALKQHVSEFEAIYCDNPLLFSSLQRMLELNEEDRADFIGLNTVIPPYKEICEYFYNIQHGLVNPDDEDDFDDGVYDPNGYDPGFNQQDNMGGFNQQYDEYGNPIPYNQADEYNQMMDQNHFGQEQMVQAQPMGRQQNQVYANQGYDPNYQNQGQPQYHDQYDNYGNGNQPQPNHPPQQHGGYNQPNQPPHQQHGGYNQPNQPPHLQNGGYNPPNQQPQHQDYGYGHGQNDNYPPQQQQPEYQNQPEEQDNDPYGEVDDGGYYNNQPQTQPQVNQNPPQAQYGGYNQPQQQQHQPPAQQQGQYGAYEPAPPQQTQPPKQYGGYEPAPQNQQYGYNPPQPQHQQTQNTPYTYNQPQPEKQFSQSSLKESDPFGMTNDELEQRYNQKQQFQPTPISVHKKTAYGATPSYTTGASTTVPSHTYSQNNNPPSTYSGSNSFTPAPNSGSKYSYNLGGNTTTGATNTNSYTQPPASAFTRQTAPQTTYAQPASSGQETIVERNGKKYKQTSKTVEEVVNGQVVKKTTLFLTPL